jgi:TM2 domain-containing membrane protein YozV
MAEGRGSSGNVIAALASFFIPGLGQLIQGRILPAVVFFLICTIGYATWFLIVTAIVAGIAHLWAIIDAAVWKPGN